MQNNFSLEKFFLPSNPAASRGNKKIQKWKLHFWIFGRGDGVRTHDLSVPNAARYQLRYASCSLLNALIITNALLIVNPFYAAKRVFSKIFYGICKSIAVSPLLISSYATLKSRVYQGSATFPLSPANESNFLHFSPFLAPKMRLASRTLESSIHTNKSYCSPCFSVKTCARLPSQEIPFYSKSVRIGPYTGAPIPLYTLSSAVALDAISNSVSRPAFFTISLKSSSAIGERHIFPKHTNITLYFFITHFLFYSITNFMGRCQPFKNGAGFSSLLRLPFVIYFAIDLSYNFLAFDRRCRRNSSICHFGNIRKIDKLYD